MSSEECFQAAVGHLPTKQLAWYNLGLSASELWQASEAEDLLHTALEAFRTVLRLDTSKRAELRYLSALALGRLLTRQAEQLVPAAPAVLLEALQSFGEAWRLVQEWGHPDLGATWGDWGKAQSLEMKQRMEALRRENGEVNWEEQLQALSKHCEEAAEKFTRAQTAIQDDDDEDMEEEEEDLLVVSKHFVYHFVSCGLMCCSLHFQIFSTYSL